VVSFRSRDRVGSGDLGRSLAQGAIGGPRKSGRGGGWRWRRGYEIYVEATDDPELDEKILVVGKKNSRAGLTGVGLCIGGGFGAVVGKKYRVDSGLLLVVCIQFVARDKAGELTR
jgi:hypothetical protein